MAIRCNCGHCKTEFLAPDKFAGRALGCPVCQQRVVVPGGPPPAPEAARPEPLPSLIDEALGPSQATFGGAAGAFDPSHLEEAWESDGTWPGLPPPLAACDGADPAPRGNRHLRHRRVGLRPPGDRGGPHGGGRDRLGRVLGWGRRADPVWIGLGGPDRHAAARRPRGLRPLPAAGPVLLHDPLGQDPKGVLGRAGRRGGVRGGVRGDPPGRAPCRRTQRDACQEPRPKAVAWVEIHESRRRFLAASSGARGLDRPYAVSTSHSARYRLYCTPSALYTSCPHPGPLLILREEMQHDKSEPGRVGPEEPGRHAPAPSEDVALLL